MDKIKPEHDRKLEIVQFLMKRIILTLSIPIEILAMTLPLTLPENLSLPNTVLCVQLILVCYNSPTSWFYIYKLKRSLAKLKTSRHVYDLLEKKIIKINYYWDLYVFYYSNSCHMFSFCANTS